MNGAHGVALRALPAELVADLILVSGLQPLSAVEARYGIVQTYRNLDVRTRAHHFLSPRRPELPVLFRRFAVQHPAGEVAHLVRDRVAESFCTRAVSREQAAGVSCVPSLSMTLGDSSRIDEWTPSRDLPAPLSIKRAALACADALFPLRSSRSCQESRVPLDLHACDSTTEDVRVQLGE